MKKKLIALTMALLLCFILVLTSCSNNKDKAPDGNGATPPPVQTLTDYELLGGKFFSEENYSTSSQFAVEGEYEKNSDTLVLTVEQDTSIDLVSTITYRVYSILTKSMVYSTTIVFDAKSLSYNGDYTNVEFYLDDEYFVVSKTFKNEKYATEIYANNGQILINKDEDVDVSSVSFPFLYSESLSIIVDDELYEIEKTDDGYKANLVSDNEFVYGSIDSITSFPLPIGDKLFLLSDDENDIVVLNSDFSIEKVIPVTNVYGTTFTDTDVSLFALNDNSLYVQIVTNIGYFGNINSAEYDYVSYDECYRVEAYKLNVTTGEKTFIENPYLFNEVYSLGTINYLLDMYDATDIGLPIEYENVAFGAYKIENKELVFVDKDAYLFTVDNDLSVTGTYALTDGARYGNIISDGRYILDHDYTYILYDKDGKVIKNLGLSFDNNDELIYTSKAIYDHDMNLVYSLKENDADVYEDTNNTIIVTTYDEETGDTVYSLIKKGSEPTEILRTNILSDKYIEIYNDNYYICEILEDEEGNEYQKVSFYTTKGTLITSVDTLAYSSIERESASAYEMTSYILETEDGFVVVILK